MKNMAVIGAGTMGNGIAHSFAQSGYRVHLIDIDEMVLDKAIQTISKINSIQGNFNSIHPPKKFNSILN